MVVALDQPLFDNHPGDRLFIFGIAVWAGGKCRFIRLLCGTQPSPERELFLLSFIFKLRCRGLLVLPIPIGRPEVELISLFFALNDSLFAAEANINLVAIWRPGLQIAT